MFGDEDTEGRGDVAMTSERFFLQPRRTKKELRLKPDQVKRLLSDISVRETLQTAKMSALLPPVGTDVFRRFNSTSATTRPQAQADEPLPPLEAGRPLPFVFGTPPSMYLNTPLEDLDPFYQNQTFMVLSRGNVIHRFNADSSLFLLPPLNLIRRAAVSALTHFLFQFVILMTLLTICVVLTMSQPPAWTHTLEVVITLIFTLEVALKVVAKGFCVGRFTFIRDPWNWLDVLVVSTSMVALFIDLEKFAVLRTVAVSFKIIALFPGVRMKFCTLIHSVTRLGPVFLLLVLVLAFLSLIGNLYFMGSLRNKCVKAPWLGNVSDDIYQDEFDYKTFINTPENHLRDINHEAYLCGNASGARSCPSGFVCLKTEYNPNVLSSFDSFPWSLLSLTRIMTKDAWEFLFHQILYTEGHTPLLFFFLLVLPVCFLFFSLFVVVVAMETACQFRAADAQAKSLEEEFDQIVEATAIPEVEEVEEKNGSEKKKHCPGSFCGLHWSCCSCCQQVTLHLLTLVTSPWFELFIIVCLILNTLVFAMIHYPMTYECEEVLNILSLLFTAIFTVEMLLKLLAMSPCGYFRVSWNIFDCLVVLLSLIQLSIANFSTTFIVLRLLRLARWWPTLHIFLKIMWGCFSILWRLTLILVVLFFTFSVVGLQLYQDDLRLLPSAPIFRWHMGDFFHSCLVVFRVLCGDLVEPLWDCMKVSGQSTCPIFFLTLIVIGRLLVLVLFVSLLLIPLQNNRTSSKGNETKLTINWIKSLFGKKDTPGDADDKCTWFSHYSRFYRSGDSPWSKFRRCCLFLVEHKVFEVFMIVTIVLSSVALVFEDIYLSQRPTLTMVLDIADHVFTYLFLLEMCLKLTGFGLKKYFSSASCWLDFVILIVSMISLMLGMLGYSELGGGLSVRSLRSLRPLRLLSRFQGLRVVIKTLCGTCASMLNIVLVSLFVWNIFSITGVRLFAGKFYSCYNETSEIHHHVVSNKSECLELIYQNVTEIQWRNAKFNFDHVGAGFLSLFKLATFSDLSVIIHATDSTYVDSQQMFEADLSMHLFFICFFIIGCFFVLNLFIRGFIRAVDKQMQKVGGKNVFMTASQRTSIARMKMRLCRPRPPVPRPQTKVLIWLFDLVSRTCFEVLMVVVICVNLLVLTVETPDDSEEKHVVLHWIHFVLILLFLVEFLLKVLALRRHYFFNVFNVVDFVALVFSIFGLFISDILEKYFLSPHIFSLLRVPRAVRLILRPQCARRIRKLLKALMMSFPALFNIGFLLFIFMFTFSSFGMFAFSSVVIDDLLNFQTFYSSITCMLMVSSGTGWYLLLSAIMATPPECDQIQGECGNPTLGKVFFCSYVILSLLLVVVMYVAVFLEIIDVDEEEQISDRDLQMFYQTWRRFDPQGSQVIQPSQLSEFCDALQEPLKVKLDHGSLPGDQIHCVDLLMALSTQVFGDPGSKDSVRTRLEELFNHQASCEPIRMEEKQEMEELQMKIKEEESV